MFAEVHPKNGPLAQILDRRRVDRCGRKKCIAEGVKRMAKGTLTIARPICVKNLADVLSAVYRKRAFEPSVVRQRAANILLRVPEQVELA